MVKKELLYSSNAEFQIPINIGGTNEVLHLNRLDDFKEDCIIVSYFFRRVSPITIDETNIIFTCTINGRRVSTPLFYYASFKCKKSIHNPNPSLSLSSLFKMERCIAFAKIHNPYSLFDISSKLEKDCTYESPNSFWTRENYFVSLPLTLWKIQISKILCIPHGSL